MGHMDKNNNTNFIQNKNAGKASLKISPIVTLLGIGIVGIGAGSYPSAASDVVSEGVTVELGTVLQHTTTQEIADVLSVAGAEMIFTDADTIEDNITTVAEILPQAGAALSEMTELPEVQEEAEEMMDSEYANLAIAQVNA